MPGPKPISLETQVARASRHVNSALTSWLPKGKPGAHGEPLTVAFYVPTTQDPDSGGNDLKNYPVLTSAVVNTANQVTISGTYNGVANPTLAAAGTAATIDNTIPLGNAVAASNVIPAEMVAIKVGMSKIRSAIFAFWRSSPLTQQRMPAVARSTSSAVTHQGPIGAKVSIDLPRNHCLCRACRSRAVTSLTMV